ncbi:uncharacterized protein NECHADRAFT_78032 [Fusarium vanettenii 77-13-4]|uniref:Uncharacterized protein n=1 Tax=Fusarium vanettenii (strain ATCC MYA-4622 / CBS 123669 / FGSC 9596 / NRRL 45880 / 77-13-4) TaxID=660122 RepID=C7YMX6_FUSV7|nr:uncharacterized protein NECHADRAFT_78032 [Fusarium vanettenii 77-13-4]EEU47026.1 predicted protein [Fusarium vanettenii 77-13-4]
MESPPKPSSQQGDTSDEKMNSVKRLLDETDNPGKATVVLNLQESTSDPESNQDEDDSSDEDDPWLNAGAQPGVPATREHGISEAEVSNGHAAEYYQERNTHDPGSWEHALALAEQDDAVGHTASVGTNPCLSCVLCPCRLLATIGKSCADIPRKMRKSGNTDTEKGQPMAPNRFELYLKKALFEEAVNISTTVDEPGWANDSDPSMHTVVFPGWNDPAEEFKLQPLGKFVAETKKALDDFLEHFQFGGNLTAMGNRGGFTSTGLPSLLKKSFTTAEDQDLALKCFDNGEVPPPQIIKVSNQATPWSSSGGGRRQALRVPEQTTEYSSGEGLIATIPQMIGLLHLQYQTLTRLVSSQAFVFEKPIDSSGGLLRRGILLKGRPEGLSHIGQNTRIAVLFPMDSAWVREQFFWA